MFHSIQKAFVMHERLKADNRETPFVAESADSSCGVELCFGGRGGRRSQVGFGACEVFEVFEEDFDAGEVVSDCLVELVWQLVHPGTPEGHGGYCWFVGHYCGVSLLSI